MCESAFISFFLPKAPSCSLPPTLLFYVVARIFRASVVQPAPNPFSYRSLLHGFCASECLEFVSVQISSRSHALHTD